jgi:hypothetical protein
MSEKEKYIKALNRINEVLIPVVDCEQCYLYNKSLGRYKCYSSDNQDCKDNYEALTTAANAICRLLSLLD